MNKSLINKYINRFLRHYERLQKNQKNIVLMVVFFVVFIISAEFLLFRSVDKFNEAQVNHQQRVEDHNSLLKSKAQVLMDNAKNDGATLLRRKKALTAEISQLIDKDNIISYVSEREIPLLLDSIIKSMDKLTIVALSNKPLSTKEKELPAVLVKHHFELRVSGSYQDLYDFMMKISQTKLINISSVTMERKGSLLIANIDFFIINRNKSIMTFQ